MQIVPENAKEIFVLGFTPKMKQYCLLDLLYVINNILPKKCLVLSFGDKKRMVCLEALTDISFMLFWGMPLLAHAVNASIG